MAVEDHGEFRTECQKYGVRCISTHASAHACALVCALIIARTRTRVHARLIHTHTHTHTHAQPQINCKHYSLGRYAVEADAAAARDVVAKVLGYRLNFKKTRKTTGQRSKSADKLVADAVKAANACVLGNSMAVGFIPNESPKS